MPFSIEQFFGVFAVYNERVWPVQILLMTAAIVSAMLLLHSSKTAARVINLILAFLWLWMGTFYHLVFFRRINSAAIIFGIAFIIEALLIAWGGVFGDGIRFDRNQPRQRFVGAALVISSLLLYPVAGYLLGQRYPEFPTFGLPCPTTIFSIGLFTFAAPHIPKSILVIPVLWTFVGSYAAFRLGVLEDLMLLPAGLIGMWMILGKN